MLCSSISVSKFQVTPGHPNYAYIEVHGIRGVCKGTDFDPPFPDFPAAVTQFNRAAGAYANGILIFCGGQQDANVVESKTCWYLDFADKGYTGWEWTSVDLYQWRTKSTALGIKEKVDQKNNLEWKLRLMLVLYYRST